MGSSPIPPPISTNQAVFVRPGANLMPRGKAQFVEDVLNVGAYCALSDHQPLGDLTIAQPTRQQRGYLALTRAQSRDLLCRTLWRPARSRPCCRATKPRATSEESNGPGASACRKSGSASLCSSRALA